MERKRRHLVAKMLENSIMITLPVIETRGKLTRSEQQIIKLIEENGEMSRKEIEEEIGLGKATNGDNLLDGHGDAYCGMLKNVQRCYMKYLNMSVCR